MSKNDKSNQPPGSNDWVERLAHSVTPHADPVRRIARHVWGDGSTWNIKYDANEYGSLHFGPPQSWLEKHPFAVPKGIFHAEHGSPPFSTAVEGGKAVVLWLTQDALMNRTPPNHAKNVLEKRVQALATALNGKFDIMPLEARLYYPKESIRNAIQGTDHDCCAALILATDIAHAPALEKARQLILSERVKAEKSAKSENNLSGQKPSSEAVERMLSLYRTPHAEGETAASILPDKEAGVREIASHIETTPQIFPRRSDGKFEITLSNGKDKITALANEATLGADEATTHVLLFTMRDSFKSFLETSPTLKDHERVPAKEYDKLRLDEIMQSLISYIGGSLRYKISTGTVGTFLCVSTNGDNQGQRLLAGKNTLDSCMRKYDAEEGAWRDYLNERHIEHQPPPKPTR